MTDVDCIVIGAGVIGLAVARALARTGRGVIIVERERRFGAHTSSRNSEVIHAGIHHAANSLKARLCVSGREQLYAYCAAHGIAHRRCGKFTVAASAAQLPQLLRLQAAALANGVADLEWLDGREARRREPQLVCEAALFSPSTGIIDSHDFMRCLLADAEACGAQIAYGSAVRTLRPSRAGIEIVMEQERKAEVRAGRVINCAGLDAHRVAASIDGFPAQYIPEIHLAKGNYFALQGASPFRHLIYPLGELGWLGIHATLDLAGGTRFGPDLEWIDAVDYAVDERRAENFYTAIKRYWPKLAAGQLTPAYCGVRPKLSGPGEPARDFRVSGPQEHGVDGIVNLFGIESPGLTASLALADYVAGML